MASTSSNTLNTFVRTVSAGASMGSPSFTVNDPRVTVNSVIMAVATATSGSQFITSIAPAAGSFTIYFNTTLSSGLSFTYTIVKY